MKLRIEIEMDNSAFENNPVPEVKRILRKIIHNLEAYGVSPTDSYPLMDVNGNKVGFAEVED